MSRTNVTARMKKEMWETHVGMEYSTKCMAGCGKQICPFDYQVGHIKAVADGGDNSICNMVPICSKCNTSMGTENMIGYIKRHSTILPDWVKKMQNSISLKNGIYVTEHQPEEYSCKLYMNGITHYLIQCEDELFEAISRQLDKRHAFINRCSNGTMEYVSGGKIVHSEITEELLDQQKPSELTWSVLDKVFMTDMEYVRRCYMLKDYVISGEPLCKPSLEKIQQVGKYYPKNITQYFEARKL